MTYKAHIKNGAVVLDEPIQLPEGAEVEVALRAPGESQRTSSLLERFEGVVGACSDLPSDMAENHDHYLHGQDKK